MRCHCEYFGLCFLFVSLCLFIVQCYLLFFFFFFFLMIRRPPRSTQSRSSAASDVYKRQVDTPGHRDFIGNMLAGIGGFDAVLLVIAADEGVSAQTREHLSLIHISEPTRPY